MHDRKNPFTQRIAGRLNPALALSVSLTLLLAGCTVGPDYRKPQISLPDHYQTIGAPAESRVDLARWWDSFGDPVLSRLIGQLAILPS